MQRAASAPLDPPPPPRSACRTRHPRRAPRARAANTAPGFDPLLCTRRGGPSLTVSRRPIFAVTRRPSGCCSRGRVASMAWWCRVRWGAIPRRDKGAGQAAPARRPRPTTQAPPRAALSDWLGGAARRPGVVVVSLGRMPLVEGWQARPVGGLQPDKAGNESAWRVLWALDEDRRIRAARAARRV